MFDQMYNTSLRRLNFKHNTLIGTEAAIIDTKRLNYGDYISDISPFWEKYDEHIYYSEKINFMLHIFRWTGFNSQEYKEEKERLAELQKSSNMLNMGKPVELVAKPYQRVSIQEAFDLGILRKGMDEVVKYEKSKVQLIWNGTDWEPIKDGKLSRSTQGEGIISWTDDPRVTKLYVPSKRRVDPETGIWSFGHFVMYKILKYKLLETDMKFNPLTLTEAIQAGMLEPQNKLLGQTWKE